MNYNEAKPSHDRKAAEINLLSPLTLRCAIASPCRPCANIPRRKASSMTGISCISAAAQLAARLSSWSRRLPSPATAASRPAIWSDAHIEPVARIARFVESQGAVPGIQIAHAGRKASCDVPWRGGRRLTESEGGWAVIAPSAIPFNPTDPAPTVLDQAGIDGIVASFEAAAGRALEAGFVGILSNQSSSLVVRRSAASI